MEVIKGRIVTAEERNSPEKEIEYLTDPVPVRKTRLSFGAIIVVQVLLAVLTGGLLMWASSSDYEAAMLVENTIRRLLNG